MTDEHIIAYLLEELPEDEAERFEDECFAGESWPEQIKLAEEDLIDEYLRGDLTPERRKRFEENYLTTDARVERVRMAAALLRHVDAHSAAAEVESPGVKPAPTKGRGRESWFGALWGGNASVPRAALSFALLLVVAAGAFVAYRLVTNSNRKVVLVALTPSSAERGVGGAEPTKVKLPPDAGTLRVSLTLPEGTQPAARYRVEFEGDEGKPESLQAEGEGARTVAVSIPAARLAPGAYILKLYAVNAGGVEQRIGASYAFIIE